MSRRFDSFLRCSLTSTGTCAHTGGCVAERLPQQLLLGRVRQVLLGAHDVGDAHLDVVDDVGQQEHRRAVAAQQHEVLDRRRWSNVDLAADEVVDDRRRPSGTRKRSTRPGPGPSPRSRE